MTEHHVGYTSSFFKVAEPRFQTMNRKIAVEPFPERGVKTERGAGVIAAVKISNKSGLVRLKVLFPSREGMKPGQFVYIRGDLQVHDWAKQEHEFEGVKYILLPESFVEAVETPDAVNVVGQLDNADWTLKNA